MKRMKMAWLAGLVLAAWFAGGCAALKSPETQEAIVQQAQKLVGTDQVLQRFDAAEERAALTYAFSWLAAEKQGITETQARDWLAGHGGGVDEDAQDEQAAQDVDAVEFASLQWKFGGVDGSKAKLSGPRISGLKASANGISYKWDTGLSAWGLADDDSDNAFACWFVTREDGSIVGGKIDWISTSRKTRDFKNVNSGYQGWTLDGVPNPCAAYFVVISRDGRKRSNVVGTEWQR